MIPDRPSVVPGVRPSPAGAGRPHLLPGSIILFATLLVAALLRFWHLGTDGLWVDEAWTALLVRQPPGRLLDLLRADDAPPLFYLLQVLITALAGATEWGLRLLPALAGTAAVVVTWRLCRARAPRAAVGAAVAIGFSTVAVHYARQARSYALLHLLAVLALDNALSMRESPGKRRAAWFVLSCLGLAYSHNLGVLLLAAAAITGIVPLIASSLHRRTGLAVLGFLVLGLVPWFAALLPQLGVHDAANAWMGAWWKGRGGTPLGFVYTPMALANGAASSLHLTVPLPVLPPRLVELRWVSWGLVFAGFIGAGWAATRRSGPEKHLIQGAAIFSVVPILGLVAISLLAGPAYVIGRTDTLVLPGVALLLGIGWSRGPRFVAPAAGLAWIILALVSLAPTGSSPAHTSKGSDRALAGLLAGVVEPGDVVVFSSLSRPSLEYYGRRLGWWERAGWTGSFPTSTDRNAAATWAAPLDSAAAWQRQAVALRTAWERRGCGAVWILALNDPSPVWPGGAAGAAADWPARPVPPPALRARRTAQSVSYPGNVLVSALAGLRPVEVAWEYRQDWVSGQRLVLHLPRGDWVPLDSIPRLETRP